MTDAKEEKSTPVPKKLHHRFTWTRDGDRFWALLDDFFPCSSCDIVHDPLLREDCQPLPDKRVKVFPRDCQHPDCKSPEGSGHVGNCYGCGIRLCLRCVLRNQCDSPSQAMLRCPLMWCGSTDEDHVDVLYLQLKKDGSTHCIFCASVERTIGTILSDPCEDRRKIWNRV